MLTEMLRRNSSFQSLPLDDQMVLARLAQAFESDSIFLYQSPEELADLTGVGNRDQWSRLLELEPTVGYIKGRMAQVTQVASRKGLLHLQQEAKAGNVQAVKQINELSGILAQEDTNRTIILHQIVRPKLPPSTHTQTTPVQAATATDEFLNQYPEAMTNLAKR